MKVLFLTSGNGGNLKFLHRIQKDYFASKFSISVIADRNCGAFKYAEKNDLKCDLIEYSQNFGGDLYDNVVLHNPDLIFTTIHRILGKNVLEDFGSKMLNLHYSLLPNYAGTIGMTGVKRATENNDFLLGVTTHRLSEAVDLGEPVIQSLFKNPKDRVISEQISFRVGCAHIFTSLLREHADFFPKDLAYFTNIIGNVVYHIPQIYEFPTSVNENFWKELLST